MTQELITQTLTTNQLPHHRKLTTMKSNVKDNENEEKLQINNAHQTPLQYIQILENNLYQVNGGLSRYELTTVKPLLIMGGYLSKPFVFSLLI